MMTVKTTMIQSEDSYKPYGVAHQYANSALCGLSDSIFTIWSIGFDFIANMYIHTVRFVIILAKDFWCTCAFRDNNVTQ